METDRASVQTQYADASNLQARSAVYRFGDPGATPWPRWVFDQLADLPPNAKVLEIGCGDGALWKRNLDRLPRGWRITMLDLSPGMLTAARRELPVAQFAFAQGDAAALPLADGRFDAVVANHMLYHIADRPAALREVRRVLAPTGKLFATTNSDTHLAPMLRLIGEFVGEQLPLPFTMENGAAQLRPTFAGIDARHVRGQLRVIDAEAVVRYVLSVNEAPQRISGTRLDELRRRAQTQIDNNSAFVFPTAAGMFIASMG
jgi:SAM-dependent methyltransferase